MGLNGGVIRFNLIYFTVFLIYLSQGVGILDEN